MNRHVIGAWMLIGPFAIILGAILYVIATIEPIAFLGTAGIAAWVVLACYLLRD